MKSKLTLVLFFIHVFCVSLFAQTVLTHAANELMHGDEIKLKQLIDTISPGTAGPNQVWDFSAAKFQNDFVISLQQDASKVIQERNDYVASDENGERISYFKITPTQRLYYGLSTDNAVVKFEQPLVEMSYPFAYGSEVKGEMKGEYIKDYYSAPINGTYELKADAWGTLILPGGVKLSNVLRVTSTRKYTQEFSGSDYYFTVLRYAFYAPGERYAVMQIKDVVYDCINCACDGTEYKAYFNGSITADANQQYDYKTGFKYKVYPNPFEDVLKIEYSVQSPAKIEMSLVDLSGRKVKEIMDKEHLPGVYSVTENMSAYKTPNYVLRMVVNDVLYTEKLIKKEKCGRKQ